MHGATMTFMFISYSYMYTGYQFYETSADHCKQQNKYKIDSYFVCDNFIA